MRNPPYLHELIPIMIDPKDDHSVDHKEPAVFFEAKHYNALF
jgi:hypothetical protein